MSSENPGAVHEAVAALPCPYRAQIRHVDKQAWASVVRQFDDANLMQTWSYGAVRWGERNLSHLVVRRGESIVAAAQCIVRKVGALGAGLAYVKSGPLWRARGSVRDLEAFRQILRSMRELYAVQQGLFLRIFQHDTENGTREMREILAEEGFHLNSRQGPGRTAIMDLSQPLEDLRMSLRPTWRRNLTLALRNNLEVAEGVDDELFAVFVKLYREMQSRKRLAGLVNIGAFQQIQKDLPPPFKMRVMICKYQGEPVAGLAVPAIGDTALALLAATGDQGVGLRASYLLHWRMVERLKEYGCQWLDLDRINQITTPGTYQFKTGLAGRLGREAEYVGSFECCTNRFSASVVSAGERLSRYSGGIKAALNGLRHFRHRAPQ